MFSSGVPFALLQQEGAPSARLAENRRQRDPVLREAVTAARGGEIKRALDALGGKVRESANHAEAGAAAWLALSPEDRSRTAIFTSGHVLRTKVLEIVRAGLIKEGALGREAIKLRTFENLNLTREQMRQIGSYAPGQRLEVYERQANAGLERGKYDVTRVDTQSGRVELTRDGRKLSLAPQDLSPRGKGASLSSPSEIEVRTGDRLIWTTNNRQLGVANGSPVEVLRIERDGITLRDATATRTLAPGNPLRESLAHGLVLNMHRAQGLTVDRAITVMDSHDRLLNSRSLFYVLSSRAREHLGLHVDSKERLANAVGKHRGDVPHAMDVARDVDRAAGAERGRPSEKANAEKAETPKPEIEKQIERGLRRSFDYGL